MKSAPRLSLKSLLFTNPWGFSIPAILGIAASLAGVALLGISGWFLSAAGLAGVIGTALVFNYLTPGALVRLMAIIRTSGRYGEQVAAHNHLLGLLRSLRLWVWDQRVATDSHQTNKRSRGDLLQRLVSDLDQVIRWPLVVFLPWLYALLAYAGVAILAWCISSILLWPILIAAFFHLIIVPYFCGLFASHAVHVGQILGVHRRGRFISLFSALITLTIRGHWQDYAVRLSRLDERQFRSEVQIQHVMTFGRFSAYLVTIALLASCFILLGEYHSDTGQWVLHDSVHGTWMIALVLSLLAVNELALPLAQAFVAQGQSQVGLRRLNQLHQTDGPMLYDTIEPIKSMTLNLWRGFYPLSGMGSPEVSFSLSVGDVLWLRGPSGSGKSTLLASLAGECPATGEVCLNNQLQTLYANKEYQAQISYLPQSPYVFQQSIAANLRLGNPDSTDDELWAVLDAVALGDWVRSLPNALETLLESQGRDLSGGQRKRLVLARLLLRKAPVLLLDEPFDGLDLKSIEHISYALAHDYRPDILVFVSHVNSPLADKAAEFILK